MGKWCNGLAPDPLCLRLLWLPLNRNPNLTTRAISPTRPFGCLCTAIMIYLSALYLMPLHPGRWMFTYLIMDFYSHHSYLEKPQSIFTQTNNIQTTAAKTAVAGLPPNQRVISEHAQVPTHTHMHVQTHLCSLPCFDRRCRCLGPTGDIMVVGKMCRVTMALVCDLLFCLCLTDRDFHRTRQRSL